MVAQLHDNSLFKGTNYRGAPADTIIISRSYHVEGNLQIVDGEAFKELFDLSLPLLKAAKGHNLVIIGLLPRYVTYRCCGDEGHLTNYNKDYIDAVAAGVKEWGIQLKNLKPAILCYHCLMAMSCWITGSDCGGRS